MKKIMIIGAGSGQVPIIRAAKNRGLKTVVVSPYGPYPGIKEADILVPVDIYDKPAVLEAAKRECIDYVISDQSDFAVPTVAYVAENMGLVGNSIATAELYSDKGRQRELCKRIGLPVPSAMAICNKSDFDKVPFGFPWVIKPADSQGSRGVRKVWCMIEAAEALSDALKYSKKGSAVAEEYFAGREVVCEGFVVDGVYHNVAFADREYFDIPDKFIPSKTIFPSTISVDVKTKLIESDTIFAEKAGTTFGIIHSEYLVDENGDYRLVETALRGGGVYISSHLIPEATGLDLTELLIDYLIIGPDSVESKIVSHRCSLNKSSAYICFYMSPGTVTSVCGLEEVRSNGNVLIAEVDRVLPGFKYDGMKHKGDRLGPFVVVGNNREDVQNTISFLKTYYKVYMDSSTDEANVWN